MKWEFDSGPTGRALILLVAGAFIGAAGLGAEAVTLDDPPGAAAVTAGGAEGLVTVTGVVHDKAGRPLAGAAVSLDGLTARAGPDGRWSLAVAAGSHELAVSLEGFDAVRRDLVVAAGLGPVDDHAHPAAPPERARGRAGGARRRAHAGDQDRRRSPGDRRR